jgi:carbonic anhydrase
MMEKYADRTGAERLNVAIQENVLAQLENLRTHPVVASALAQDRLRLHGWVYKIETGEVFVYEPTTRQFGLAPTPLDLPAPNAKERVDLGV